MIKRIAISGYQSLDNVVLDLGKITVLTGETGQGKSAVKRALEGFITNKPERGHVTDTGDKEDSLVIIETEDGKVGWRKGKNNRYKINDNPALDKVGSSCPEEVRQFLKMDVMDFGGNVKITPNFHSQFDRPFLVDQTGTVISKVLGEVTNVGKIILATKEAKSRKNSNSIELEFKRAELGTTIADLEALNFVDTIAPIVASLDEKIKGISKLSMVMSDFTSILGKIEELIASKRILDTDYMNIYNLLERVSDLDVISAYFDSLNTLSDFYDAVTLVQEEIEDHTQGLSFIENSISMAVELNDKLSLDGLRYDLDSLALSINEVNTCKSLISTHNSVRSELTNLEKLVSSLTVTVAHLDSTSLDADVKSYDDLFGTETFLRSYLDRVESLHTEYFSACEGITKVRDDLIVAKNSMSELEKEQKVCPLCERAFE